jgi:hypothetical protein
VPVCRLLTPRPAAALPTAQCGRARAGTQSFMGAELALKQVHGSKPTGPHGVTSCEVSSPHASHYEQLVFCGLMSCSPVNTYRRFGVRYCLHLHGRRDSQATSMKQNLVAGCWFSLFFHPEGGDAAKSHYTLGVVSPLRFLSRVPSPQFTLHCSSENKSAIFRAVTCFHFSSV